MADKTKKVEKMKQDNQPEDDSENETESEGEGTHPEAYSGNEEIQVDFEGRNPTDSDFHGIRQLLQQLFLKAHLNISELADLIIAQNYVGSVVIQSEVDDEDDDDEIYDSNMVFGITTAINITNKQDIGCINELKAYILARAEANASEGTLTYFREALCNQEKPVGFLVNERFINIPAQISVPLLESLHKEIKRANEKKMPYDFVYLVMLIKFHRRLAKKNRPAEDIFSNSEEEAICKEAIQSFEYSVQDEADSGKTGDWLEKDSRLVPYRKIILFDAKKLPEIIVSVNEFINK